MRNKLENLSSKEYPGRVIIIGKEKSGKRVIVIYAITGRSPSSQARKLVLEKDTIWARPSDEEILENGKAELLIYPAICLSKGIVVGNGKQTLEIKENLGQNQDPSGILRTSLSSWDYEPDPPLYTPRIAGCVVTLERAALGIIRKGKAESSIRDIFEYPLVAGKGKMISTYRGENREPLASFSGEPLGIDLKEHDSKGMAEAVYEALGPKEKGKDYRVAVACIFSSHLDSKEYSLSIINRLERMEKSDGKIR